MTENITEKLVVAALKMLFPDGGNIWIEKVSGDLGKTIEGMSGSYYRDIQNVLKIKNALRPQFTDFLSELDLEFINQTGDLTEQQRRDRIRERFNMMFSSESRIALMQSVIRSSGFPDVVIRNLGWYGTPESPYDFFPDSAASIWGDADWGDLEWGDTEITGNAYLMINGGSIEYVEDPENALLQLEQVEDYWTEYLVVEGESQSVLDIPANKREVFFELLYMLKPGHNHIILNANFTA